ncbi:MAG: threonine/serine dehydratase [Acidobacteria bacterium]|nr:threonine/serine dehydratase [Acidobacteriota bacterium]
MPSLVPLAAIREAAVRIAGVAVRTPLVASPMAGAPRVATASPPAGPPQAAAGVPAGGAGRLLLKCENLQRAGAFKLRGAYNFIAQVPAERRAPGLITYSSGNHAQAVALAARTLGAPAVVVMPETAPAVKVAGARALGAEVLFEGTTSVERRARAEAEAERRGLSMVPPFDHPRIIAGQGTVGLEILEDCPAPAAVYVPIGGGGLMAGVAAAIKALRPATRIVGVEPVGADAMARSVQAGAPVTLDRAESIADGLLPVRPGDLTFAHAAALVDEIVTVDDAAIAAAVRWLAERAKLVAEPSGAASVAAALRGATALHGADGGLHGADGGLHGADALSAGESATASGPTVAVVSGGNIAPAALADFLRAPAGD